MRIRMIEVTLCIAAFAVGATAQTVTGSGTAGNVPVFTGSSTLGSSPITLSGSNVGIGTTSPEETLDVFGTIEAAPIPNTTGTSGWFMEGRTTADEAAHSVNAVGLGISIDNGGANAYSLTFGVNPPWPAEQITERMRITSSGNVGIGTATPGATLEVDGSVKLTSGSGASLTFADGTVQSTAYTGVTCGGDYAESVDVAGLRTSYEPGDVLVIGPDSGSDVIKSSEPYSTVVAGVYSTKPGVVGRRQTTDSKASKTEVPMAMIGIVPTKVSAENGPIKRGDLLVTSSIPGYAMKGTDRSRLIGAVIGKALGNLNTGTGVVEALITLQ